MSRHKSRNIQTTIAVAFGALVLAMAIVIAVLSYTFTQNAVQQTARDYTGQLVSQVQSSIDSYITHMENIAEVVQLNEQVQQYFGNPQRIAPEQEQLQRERITTFLNSVSRTRNDISLILIIGAENRVLAHDREIEINRSAKVEEQRWFQAAREANGPAVVSSSHVQNIVEGEYRWVITLSRTINDIETGAEKGVLIVDLNFSVIKDLLNNISLGKKGYLFIVDPEGRIVYHPRQELIYSDLEQEYIDRVLSVATGSFMVSDEKGRRIYTVSTSTQTGWRTVGVNYVAELVQNRGTIQRYYLYWGLICVAVAILVAVLISHQLSRPILRLRRSMQAVERGDFDIAADVSGNNEIAALAKDFNIMIAQIKELVRRNKEEQEQKRRSELMALQNQITPHFLYNTLDSVIWMAEGRNTANVVKTVSALARLLRLSISRGDELISIRDEIEHIKSYLTIQKLRYRDKLDFSIEVDPALQELKTPKVILQPLVENAIYHGIKNKEGAGKVTISGVRVTGSEAGAPGGLRDGAEHGDVLLRVEDDGVGMSDEKMARMLEPDVGSPGENGGTNRHGSSGDGELHSSGNGRVDLSTLPRRRTRVGVLNVHERIRLYFGDRYGLSFSHNDGSGTVVEVRLPVIRSEQEAQHE